MKGVEKKESKKETKERTKFGDVYEAFWVFLCWCFCLLPWCQETAETEHLKV